MQTQIRAGHAPQPANADDLVYVYAWLYYEVCGVLPLSLINEVTPARNAARLMTQNFFEGDFARALDFLKWTWAREKWRRDNDRQMKVISWRLQFSKYLIEDYQVAHVRRNGRE